LAPRSIDIDRGSKTLDFWISAPKIVPFGRFLRLFSLFSPLSFLDPGWVQWIERPSPFVDRATESRPAVDAATLDLPFSGVVAIDAKRLQHAEPESVAVASMRLDVVGDYCPSGAAVP
jgi:hypothetical protein